jgi:hypothetical protein
MVIPEKSTIQSRVEGKKRPASAVTMMPRSSMIIFNVILPLFLL